MDTDIKELSIMIDSAIKKNLFTLYYQPKIDLNTNEVVGAEALIRLKDKDRIIPPSEFIPVAEESGEIIKIDEWVFRQVVKDAREFFVKSNIDIRISFNVSALHFQKETFVSNLEKMFSSTKDFNAMFEIEITESAILKDIEKAKRDVKHLKETGFRISIDDFGTGYASLTYLKDFPIDTLKIDKSFIDRIETDKKSKNIVDGIIYLCNKLNINSVAEGVENAEQVDILKEFCCNKIQGYFYAQPKTLDDFILFVKSFNNTSEKVQFIKWSKMNTTGSYAIDSQHMIIINLLNNLFNILHDKKKRENFPIKHFIEILDRHIMKHYKVENLLMEKYNYPYMKEHLEEHQNFIEKYNDFKSSLSPVNERNLYNFFNLLKKWFYNHEIMLDKKMIDYITQLSHIKPNSF